MRIVFVIPHADLSGGCRTVATHARLLAQRGHRVTLVSAPSPHPPLKVALRSVLAGRGWPGSPDGGPSHVEDARVEHVRLDRVRPVEDRDVPEADAVVATWWRTAEWVARLSPRKGTKFHFVQGLDGELPGQPAARVAATWQLPLRRIVCSRWLADVARTTYGDPDVACVPNGVDAERFSAPPRDRQAAPTVGLVYSDAWIKGGDIAADAVRIARLQMPGLRLVAFGIASPSVAVPLPSGTEFHLRPPQDEIPRLYARCDAWLWPSRREGFGLPLLEAMACRTPVIAAPAGAAPDILGAGGGVLLPEPSAPRMAEALRDVLSLPAEGWRALSDAARAVAATHDWQRSTEAFEAALVRNLR